MPNGWLLAEQHGGLLSLELWSFLYWDLPTGVVGFCFQAEKGVQTNFPAHLKNGILSPLAQTLPSRFLTPVSYFSGLKNVSGLRA